MVYYSIKENPLPVFSTLIPDQAYVIKDNLNYKLYYAGEDFFSINLAQSPDGITWTPYDANPIISGAQYHSSVKYYSTVFQGADHGTNPSSLMMNYRIWYQGLTGNSISGWRYAESQDGINWYNHIAVAQFGPQVFSSLTGVNYGIADVIYTEGASNTGTDWNFRIYANVQWEGGAYAGKELVVMAFSVNGYDWTGYDPSSAGYATPIFAGTLDNRSYDSGHIGWFKVIRNSPTDWQAFYSGGKETTYQALNGIGYATSIDGINWIRSQSLFMTSQAAVWRNQSVWMPSVVKTENGYEIFFLASVNPYIDTSNWIQWKLYRAILTPDSAAAVAVNTVISATFSEEMDPETITTDTFLLMQGSTPIPGSVLYSGVTAFFTPAVNLTTETVYTVRITTGVRNLAGDALNEEKTWNIITEKNYDWSDPDVNPIFDGTTGRHVKSPSAELIILPTYCFKNISPLN